MTSPDWSGAPPREGQATDPYNSTHNQQNVYDAADQISQGFRNFSLQEDERQQQQYQTQQYVQHQQYQPFHRYMSPSEMSLNDSRTSPNPLHGNDDPLASPAATDSRPASIFNGYSNYGAYGVYLNRRFDRGSFSSSVAGTPAPQIDRMSMQGNYHYGVPTRQPSQHSSSGRMGPQPIDEFARYHTLSPEVINAQPVQSLSPSLSFGAPRQPQDVPYQMPPPIPPQIPEGDVEPSPLATPRSPTPEDEYKERYEDKYGQQPEVPPTPGRPTSATPNLNHTQPMRPPPVRHPVPGYGLPTHLPSRDPNPRHSLSSPTVPTVPARKPIGSAANGVGRYQPSPIASPQPSRSVPAMPGYNPPELLSPSGRGGGSIGHGRHGSSIRSISPRAPTKHYIAIGIDFGTTYSGVSWAYSANPNNIHDVQHYPSSFGNNKARDEAQVPTLLDFKSRNWGFLIQGSDDPIRWFKLLLLKEADIPHDIATSEYLRVTREKTKHLGDDGPIQLVATFLKELWRTALSDIAREVGRASLDNMPIKVALTVPAIWPGYAKDAMKRAARIAGILDMRDAGETELILVQEPEAAALSTLMDRREYPDMVEGETFMVVDCGGGTIDVISYKVLSVNPFRVCEVVGGAGKLCGAFMIDDKFVDYMRNKTPFKFDSCSPDEWRQFVYTEWEHTLKRNFTWGPEQKDQIFLTPPFQAIPAYMRMAPSRMAPKKVTLKKEIVNGFFEETYQGIASLVREQNAAILHSEHGVKPRAIVLVGGLGSSNYLLRRLQQDFHQIMQPQRSWSAVARGAVIAILRNYNLPYVPQDMMNPDQQLQLQNDFSTLPEVASRIARMSYGVNTGIPVSEAVPRADRSLDQFYNQPGAEQRVWRMKWFVTKGEKLDNRDPVSHKFYELVDDAQTKSTRFEIYVSPADTPPVRLDATCSLLCTLTCQYDTPFDSLPVVNPSTGTRIVEDMRLTMRFGAEPEWRLQVGRHDVKEKVNVDFQIG